MLFCLFSAALNAVVNADSIKASVRLYTVYMRQGRAETFGGAGAQNIKGAHDMAKALIKSFWVLFERNETRGLFLGSLPFFYGIKV